MLGSNPAMALLLYGAVVYDSRMRMRTEEIKSLSNQFCDPRQGRTHEIENPVRLRAAPPRNTQKKLACVKHILEARCNPRRLYGLSRRSAYEHGAEAMQSKVANKSR